MAVKRRSFAQARRAAGYTQESLAEHLGVDRTTVARWESGEYTPQPWLRPKIAQALGLSLGGLRELVDGVDTTGSTVEVSASLVRADANGVPVPPVGYDQVPAVMQEHDRLREELELIRAYAEARALHAPVVSPQVPWETDRLAVSIAQAILEGFVTATGVELAEGLVGPLPLMPLAFLSSTIQTTPAEWEDRLRDQLKNIFGEWAYTMNRRQLLGLLEWAAATVAASPVSGLDTDEQERLTRAIALPRRVDATVIDHIETMLLHCKRQEDALGPQAVLQTVLAQRQLVDALLTQCPESLRPRLLSVYSSMSSSVGFYCFDLDDPDSAMRYCDQARAAAQEARNTELAVYALCNMSYFASWHGKAHAGIDFAAAAQNLASKTDDVLLRVCTAERAGTACAVDGQYKECMEEFDKALATFESSAGLASPESPAYWYHEGLIASQQSDCLLRLGQPQQAASRASAGLQLFDNSFVGSLAFCTLRLGTAHLQSGEVEEAARVVGDGVLLASQSRSVRLTREVQTIRGRMEPWRETSVVRELDERLVGCGFGV
jgi:DNA-binding XRE family transcriptional regulator/tetratricopeptide (TPR) repeat protein